MTTGVDVPFAVVGRGLEEATVAGSDMVWKSGARCFEQVGKRWMRDVDEMDEMDRVGQEKIGGSISENRHVAEWRLRIGRIVIFLATLVGYNLHLSLGKGNYDDYGGMKMKGRMLWGEISPHFVMISKSTQF